MFKRGQRRLQLGDHGPAVEGLAAVGVAVDGEQHLWLDLLESVDHAAAAHVGRAARPDRAQAGAGQQRHHRLGDVRQVGDHPVAAAHTHVAQRRRDRGDLAFQLGPADLGQRLSLGLEQHGRALGRAAAEDMLGIVELRAHKPLRAGHGALGQHLGVGGRCLHIEELPDRGPEILKLRHRPAPELLVAVEVQLLALGKPFHIRVQPAIAPQRIGRLPEECPIGVAVIVDLVRMIADRP